MNKEERRVMRMWRQAGSPEEADPEARASPATDTALAQASPEELP